MGYGPNIPVQISLPEIELGLVVPEPRQPISFRELVIRFRELERRLMQGSNANLAKEMQAEAQDKYIDYFRLSPQLFDKLLKLIASIIIKEQIICDPILAETRLHITLRFLASGDSIKSMSYAFRVGHNTISKIVSKTCQAIWNCLKDTIFFVDNRKSWQFVAHEFEQLWNFPNCIRAVDGKHVMIQAPPKSAFIYYNYKRVVQY
ncbi:protein ANTAGONIST OF LIKE HETEROCHROMATIN PROTEIN 1-like [Solenopsis invicta]|uniref:protein ANTAGONIST OF LIKE HETEROCHROMATIN PROTEIN 1-like n=1 Tax=Solenopsis invicta TaxID=13686 RepID=UPI00193C9185|nr:protein ANTAGONIST OF LIKE HETEROCHROMATIN PROTEIN 1-like [Solenopsis invicta]